MHELISVIVTTYQRPDALAAVLRGFAAQADRDFELIVADDGSGPDVAQLVDSWRDRIGVPLHHVWHADRGFRAAEIRNRAIAAAAGTYCVFVDGDCIPGAHFVAAHRALSEPGWFVAGNRILLSSDLTERVLRDGLAAEAWSAAAWIAAWRDGGVNRLAPALRLPLGPLRKLEAWKWRGIRSANLAVWRHDLIRIDGYDAAFSGWGREDSDLVIRLMRAGVRRKDGRFATGVLHLWHPESDRSLLVDNDARLDELMRGDRIRANAGLSTLTTNDQAIRPDAAGAVR